MRELVWLLIWALFALGVGIGLRVTNRIGHPLVLTAIGLVIGFFAFMSLIIGVGFALLLPSGLCFGAALRAVGAKAS